MILENLALEGQLLRDEPLRRYTTWRVGGPAQYLYIPANLADLSHFLKQIAHLSLPIIWLGLGSNVLIRDGGIPGIVIYTQGGLSHIDVMASGLLRVEAGVPCAKVAKFSVRNQLTGAEFLAGIPGTMGGALAMNAGAFGSETWPFVARVEIINRQGEITHRNANEFVPQYRSIKGLGEDEWFAAAHLQLTPIDAKTAENNVKTLLKKRNDTQPIGEPSCGSVFKNPPNQFAAQLIEQCGLKGKTIGKARVSLKHANFIVHDGNACAEDIEALIYFVQESVLQQCGLLLESEVKILGINTQN